MTGERTVVELVQRLTGDWQSFEGGTLRTEGPLIGLLRSRMRSSMGMTHGGHSLPNERAALNLAAFQTYEFIKETAAQMFAEVLDGEPDRRFPEANLIAWRDEWDLADRRGEIIDAQRARARRRLQGLVTRIDVLFDPPKVYEIAGVCPNPECGERYWYTDSTLGSRTSTLFATIIPGEPVIARCHWCATSWEGEDELDTLYAGITREDKTA